MSPDLIGAYDHVVVGRQPITDRHGQVVAYELLYRARDVASPTSDGEQMTTEVVFTTLAIGLDQLVGDRTVFCNADRGVLTGATPVALPPERTVIEVLETVSIDDEAVEGCRRLAAQGYRLALDDFTWCAGAERLLALATIVKIDVQAHTRHDAAVLVERCRPYGVRLLAEKVETVEDVRWAMDQGFDLFQGYAIERPSLVHGRSLSASSAGRVQLALGLLAEDLDFTEIEQVLHREPGLVVQVLQLASAGSHGGMRRPVRSVREALVLLGTARIRQWVALVILNQDPGHSPDGLTTALERARMCELIARADGVAPPAFAFTAGLLSALDLLLGVGLEDLGRTLDVDRELKAAAFRHAGPVGELVDRVVRYQDDLLRGREPGSALDQGTRLLDDAAAEAFAWAMPVVAGLA